MNGIRTIGTTDVIGERDGGREMKEENHTIWNKSQQEPIRIFIDQFQNHQRDGEINKAHRAKKHLAQGAHQESKWQERQYERRGRYAP